MKRALILGAVTAGSLVGLVPAAQADLRVSSNFRLSSDANAFRAKDQVGLAVDPSNPDHIVEVNADYLNQQCEATTSTDGGATWSPATTFTLPPPGAGEQAFQPSCFVGSHLAENTFQSVKFGNGQNVYATFAPPRKSTANASGIQGRSVAVVKSTDGGQSWGTAVVAMAGGASDDAGPYYELPTVAVDRGQGTAGADRVYLVAHEETAAGGVNGDVATSVSNDGGATFSAVVNADPNPEDATEPSPPVVNSDHSVSVAWRQVGKNPTDPTKSIPQGAVRIARSTNAGQVWSTPVTVTGVTAGGRPAGCNGGASTNPPTPATCSHVTPLPSSASTFPRLAGADGKLYIVYGQEGPPTNPAGPTPPAGGYQGAEHFIGPDSDVYFQRSNDLGATWSTPKLINDANPKLGTPITQTRHPDVSVAPNGRVDIVWQDRRHWFMEGGTAQTEHDCIHTHFACDEARLGDTYYSYSTDGGSTFSANHRINDRSHNNDVGFDYRFGNGWAFGPQAVELGNNQLLVGWMDAREGNTDTDNQDIYLAKVDHNGSSVVAQEPFARSPDASQFSVDLSRRTYPGGGEGTLAGTFATKNSTKPVIVNEAEIGQVLASGVLARANLGPVLLSPAGGLPASVKAEIGRLNPAGAYVIGDAGSLSAQVVADLASAGVPNDAGQIVRLDGGNDAGDAKGIADAMDRRFPAEKTANTPAFDAAVIVNPTSPAASAVAGLAAARRLPVLFTSSDGQTLPPETTAALANGDLAITKTLVIGGSSVVSDAVLGGLPNPTRLGGADQYDVSKAVVNESRSRGLPTNIVYVADGASPMDGALVGSAVGRTTGIELLAPAALDSNAPTEVGELNLSGQVDRLVLLQLVVPTPPIAIPSSPGPTAVADKSAPSVTRYGLTRNPFAVGGRTPTFGVAAKVKRHKKGTTFRYTLSEAATVKIVIARGRTGRRRGKRCVATTRRLRKAKKCVRLTVRGTLTRTSRRGANSVGFSGRIGSKRLTPGHYQATLTATDAARNTSRPKTITFTIVSR